jgi:PAS domain S-box-containing protein
MMDSALDAIIVMDPDGKVVEWNAAAEATFKYRREQAVGRQMAELVIPEPLRRKHLEGLARYLRTGEARILSRRIEMPALRADGSEFPAELTVVRVASAGRPLFTGFVRDLSERKRAEEALRTSEERLRLLAESSSDIVYRFRVQPPGFEYVSPAAANVLGYTPEEHYADPDLAYKIIHPGDRHLLEALVGRGTYGHPVELRWIRKDGTIVVVEHRDTPVRDETGTIIAVHGIGREVTERRRTESEQRFLAEVGGVLARTRDSDEMVTNIAEIVVGSLADYCVVALIGGDHKGPVVRVLHAAPSKAGIARALASGSSSQSHLPLVGSVLETGRSTLVSEVGPRDLEALARTTDDLDLLRELAPVSYMGVPLVARGRLMGALILISSDLRRQYHARDLRLTEEVAHRISLAIESARLYQAAQDAIQARDDLVGIVAHDLRNPLAAVNMAAANIIRNLPTAAARTSIRKAAEMIRRATDRANGLIQDLLDVTRIEAGSLTVERAPLEVPELIAEVTETFALMATEASLHLTTEIPEQIPLVLADKSRVLQVFSNVVGNAMKFTPPGGSVRVGAVSGGGSVCFRVEDTGPGIPGDQIPHLFDRFWQGRHGDRRGAGLGLPIAKGIVEAHGGRLWVESRPGHGTAFYFTLPVASDIGDRSGEAAHPGP